MFELVDIEDHIPLPAPTFPKDLAAFPLCSTSSTSALHAHQQNPPTDLQTDKVLSETRARFRQSLLSAIAAKFLFRVVPDVGFAVSIASLLQVADDVHLLPGQSKVWVHCTFTLVIFKPQVGDRLRAKIVEQDPIMGIRLSVEFFDNIIVPPSRLVEGSEWEPTIQQWGIRDENGAFIRYVNNVVVPQKKQQQDQQQQQSISKDENNNNNINEDAAAASVKSPNEPEPRSPTANISAGLGLHHAASSASSLLPSIPQPGSVICVIEKVNVTTSSDEQQQAQLNANNANSSSLANASAMKIFGSFSTCDGLGPEAWFEENE